MKCCLQKENREESPKFVGIKSIVTNEVRSIKDSNGNPLKEGDSVVPIKSLPVKDTSITLNKGMVIKNIHLIEEDDHNIECKVEKVRMVQKTGFLKKG